MSKLPLEKITWLDHSSYEANCWREKHEIENLGPFEVVSVGYILKEAKDYITIVSTIAEVAGKYLNEFCILKGTIVKRTKLHG